MLGTIATASLGKALVQASIVVAVLIAIFTVLPFALNKITGEQTATTPSSTPPAGTAEALGIGDTKVAPLDFNLLDNADDDLLKVLV